MVNLIGVEPLVQRNEMSKESFAYQSTVRHESCANVVGTPLPIDAILEN